MRNLKKVLALVLAMAMSLSLAVTAGAAFNDQDKIVNEEAVDMCVALHIINGRTNGDFDPAGNVTRAEAAKMITIALNGGKEPVLSASATPIFADIAGHWAAKYIEYCVSEGIVAGKSATSFDPNGNVTGVELAKMLLIALGYNAEHGKFLGGNWDTNVNVVASQKDLYEDLEIIDPAAAATRDTAAQMVWNALKAIMVEYDYKLTTDANGNITSELKVKDIPETEKNTLLEKKYNSQSVTGIITKVEFDAEDAEYSYTVQGVNDKIVTEADYSDLFGHRPRVALWIRSMAHTTTAPRSLLLPHTHTLLQIRKSTALSTISTTHRFATTLTTTMTTPRQFPLSGIWSPSSTPTATTRSTAVSSFPPPSTPSSMLA